MQKSDLNLSYVKQVKGVCTRMEELLNEEISNDVYEEMFLDELTHLQKLVVEITRNSLISEASNNDEAFFAGELNSVLGEEEK